MIFRPISNKLLACSKFARNSPGMYIRLVNTLAKYTGRKCTKSHITVGPSIHWNGCVGALCLSQLIASLLRTRYSHMKSLHDDVIKWKHFPRYWPFLRGIHRWPVNSPHKGQWRGALIFSLICVWMNGWVNNHEAGDLRRRCAHYDVTVMTRDIMW